VRRKDVMSQIAANLAFAVLRGSYSTAPLNLRAPDT
jgi:hypothetical protein